MANLNPSGRGENKKKDCQWHDEHNHALLFYDGGTRDSVLKNQIGAALTRSYQMPKWHSFRAPIQSQEWWHSSLRFLFFASIASRLGIPHRADELDSCRHWTLEFASIPMYTHIHLGCFFCSAVNHLYKLNTFISPIFFFFGGFASAVGGGISCDFFHVCNIFQYKREKLFRFVKSWSILSIPMVARG